MIYMMLRLYVKPGSKGNGIEGYDPWREAYVIRLTSPPRKGKANQELVSILSEALSVEQGEVEIIRGHKDRLKEVRIKHLEGDVIERVLGKKV